MGVHNLEYFMGKVNIIMQFLSYSSEYRQSYEFLKDQYALRYIARCIRFDCVCVHITKVFPIG